jgi:hypothetical protein
MNRILLIAALAVAAYFSYLSAPVSSGSTGVTAQPDVASRVRENSQTAIDRAYANHLDDQQVEGEGTVVRTLADDRNGSRHQRFIVRLDSGLTVLVAHNIDLASRIDALREGDSIAFYGEYEWNPKGGVIHWTHRDPQGRHPDGWIRHNGQTYQ